MTRDPIDPTGLIRESFRIDGITTEECRTIFLEWAMGIAADVDAKAAIRTHLVTYSDMPQDHPMIVTLSAALADVRPPKRRGGRRARVPE
ncbi:hypothetical protein CLV80_101257 [Yoonia maritima]|uniref:Uncharacterized protein n=1 Tax=Yoonia maritima TaxID=1435347 RepID=A0A2T0W4K7_9RHOB|nr:hypothetical protein [Yoonia maritima]PRY80405.1 hypothetical protein CLV80_101257 [Yoonia maritima]